MGNFKIIPLSSRFKHDIVWPATLLKQVFNGPLTRIKAIPPGGYLRSDPIKLLIHHQLRIPITGPTLLPLTLKQLVPIILLKQLANPFISFLLSFVLGWLEFEIDLLLGVGLDYLADYLGSLGYLG